MKISVKAFLLSLFVLAALFMPSYPLARHTIHAGVDPETVFQGKTFVATVFSEKPVAAAWVQAFGRNIRMYSWTYKWRAIVGVPMTTATGRRKLTFYLYYKDGTKDVFDRYVDVRAGSFQVRRFNLSTEKKELLSPEIVRAEWEKIEAVLKKDRKDPLWDGRFIIPAKGVMTLPFGAVQYINGQRSGQHNGVDYANKIGTEIYAANSGQVVLAEQFRAHGGMIVIDHGNNVFTKYLHLSRIAVYVGQAVLKGELIGYMGNTGVATGSHLHWGMSVNNVRVDPLEWVNRTVAK